MPVSISELKIFLDSPGGARFVKTNLHLHTPATPWDWDAVEGQTRKARSVSVADYFEALSKTSLDLVAITDHNCVSWCGRLIELAAAARKAGTSRIHILPGVEITTYEGPHVVGIFDESADLGKIELMLSRLGMSGKGEKEDKVGRFLSAKSPHTIQEVFEEIDSLGGIVVGPHVDNSDGLWGFKGFRSRNEVLNNRLIRILAAPSGSIKKVSEAGGSVRLLYKNMDTSVITNSFGFVNVSDCHRLDDFEEKVTWIKMTKPSLEGVQQVIYEPELRVCHEITEIHDKEGRLEFREGFFFTDPSRTAYSHPHIIGISVNGAMLDGLKVALSPNQNSIIGRNYAGKSALLDCIRFALNAVPSDPDKLAKFTDRMKAFIGDGGDVTLYLSIREKFYAVTRVFTWTKLGKSAKPAFQITGTPEVYLLWNGSEFKRDSGRDVREVFPIEVYPQGEVTKIKENADQQMNIVDSLGGIDLAKRDVELLELNGAKTVKGELKDNRESIVGKLKRRDELKEAASGIDQLQKEIEELEQLSTSPAVVEKKLWAEEELKIDGCKKELLRLEPRWKPGNLVPQIEFAEDKPVEVVVGENAMKGTEFKPESASPSDYSMRASEIFETTVKKLKESTLYGSTAITKGIEGLSGLENLRKARSDELDEKIKKAVKPGDARAVGDGLIDHITERRKTLAGLLDQKREFEQAEKEIAGLFKQRKALLQRFGDRWSEIKKKRQMVVEMISRGSASTIKAELIINVERTGYRGKLTEIVDRLTSVAVRISHKEDQLTLVTDGLSPKELADLVRGRVSKGVTDKCVGVTPNTETVLFCMNDADILQLEECLLDDRFVISYQREGDTEYTPVDSGLSGGEQALALISVAMVPKGLPLIIDQPEDELGPGLITHELVEQIRKVKSERQLIFVTHVPNIPVLADSEQVLYMEQKIRESQKKSEKGCCGSLEDVDIVEHLLELDGGNIAFEKRSQRYSRVTKTK
ncbi:MAG: AAA family ATPase [Dehalogenimonas sp.]|uniref:AAA family ATPase n=1 Tax=Candidatus Dehalogenimonas loeffleri TaxID=3127115 RepID=A0ABZ2J7F7_9CHLR|nr:AAA family ATPase [Dehalogenimonas sp.]